MMSEEGVFRRLLELIQGKKNSDAGLQRMLLESLYEMSRIQRLRVEDLSRFYLSSLGLNVVIIDIRV